MSSTRITTKTRFAVSENGRHLVGPACEPFLWLADTAWSLFYKAEREMADRYLKNRAEKGFSVIMPVVLWREDTKPANPFGEPPLHDWDPDRPNEKFFQHVDWIIECAVGHGLAVAMLPTWGEHVGPLWHGDTKRANFSESGHGPEIFSAQNAQSYGRFLGKRYRDYPVLWVIGGDRNPVNDYYQEIWRAMAKGLREGSGPGHPITYHPCAGSSSSKWFHDEPWLDFNMVQSGLRLDFDPAHYIAADFNREPVKPVLDGETRYEDSYERSFAKPRHGRRLRDRHVREAAYSCLLAGAAGHTYGCRDVWFFYEPNDSVPMKDVKTDWHVAMDFPGASQLAHFRTLFERYPFHRLRPDYEGTFLIRGNLPEYTCQARAGIDAEKSAFALVYVPDCFPVWIDLSLMEGSSVIARWFDPRTGLYSWDSHRPATGVERFVPTDATGSDWVLVLETELPNHGDRQ